MRNYQLVLVLRPSLKDTDRKKLLGTIKEWFKDAKITKEEEWGQKPLAYKIAKEVSGSYLNYFLEVEETLSKDLEKKLLAHDDVLRHLLIRVKVKGSSFAKASEDKQKLKVEDKKEVKAVKEKPKKEVKSKGKK